MKALGYAVHAARVLILGTPYWLAWLAGKATDPTRDWWFRVRTALRRPLPTTQARP